MGNGRFLIFWRNDPFRFLLIVLLAGLGFVLIWLDYGQQFLDFVAGRGQPLSVWGGGGGFGFAPPETVAVPLLGEVRVA